MLNDFQKIGVTASPEETLSFLSQQYHRAWWAGSHNRSLRTVIVNRFYQGSFFLRTRARWSSLLPGVRFVELAARAVVCRLRRAPFVAIWFVNGRAAVWR
jgi:hypothetical protein